MLGKRLATDGSPAAAHATARDPSRAVRSEASACWLLMGKQLSPAIVVPAGPTSSDLGSHGILHQMRIPLLCW